MIFFFCETQMDNVEFVFNFRPNLKAFDQFIRNIRITNTVEPYHSYGYFVNFQHFPLKFSTETGISYRILRKLRNCRIKIIYSNFSIGIPQCISHKFHFFFVCFVQLTKHLISGHINSCNAKCWIRIGCVFIHCKFPIVNSS